MENEVKIMDYEKAYKESFEAAKGLHDAGNALTKKQMEIVFPQLAESEDERIRTRFIEYFQGFLEGNEDCYKDGGYVRWEGLDVKSILAWLEKQKEQKPAEWDELQADFRNINEAFEDGKKEVIAHPEKYSLCKPVEWSEEDDDMLNSCISSIEEAKENRYAYKETDGDTSYDHEIAWLESLRNRVGKESLQPHWKPNEEQMRALRLARSFVVDDFGETTTVSETLKELEEQLKKL